MNKVLTIFRMASRLSRIGGLAERLNVSAVVAGATAEEASTVERGVVAAVTNAIEHGYGGQSNMPMKIVVGCTPQGLNIDVFDSGPAIPPAVIATMRGCRNWDPSDPAPETGKGLPTIGACMDGVSYDRRMGVNRLRLSKGLTCTAAAKAQPAAPAVQAD